MASLDRPGEFELIARYFAPIAGVGALGLVDDAALLTPPADCDLVISKDALVAGVHFLPDDPPVSIAQKALRVNLSDIAAKGARPLGFLLGLGLPVDWTEAWLAEFARGLAFDAVHYGCPLLGGDTVKSGERLFLSVTVIGAVPTGAMVKRSGGRPGDLLYVTGVIGASALGLDLILEGAPPWSDGLDSEARARLIRVYHTPQPPVRLAEAVRTHASAAMDVSDGLIGDAIKLSAASGAGFEIEAARVPLPHARLAPMIAGYRFLLDRILTGGDDYQVLAAIPPERAESFEQAARDLDIPATRIGRLTGAGRRVIGLEGEEMQFTQTSFGHF